MDVTILIALILLNGAFAMSEIALVTARKSRLQKLAEKGDKSAAVAIRLGEEPTQFLSTVQIGITAIGILNGIVGESVLADPLAIFLHSLSLGLDLKTSSIIATTLVVIVITYFSIVVGELVPKRIAQFNAEGIARLIARPIALLAKLSSPFVFLLSTSTDALLKLLGKTRESHMDLTQEDIHAILVEGSQSGIIEEQEHQMVRNVFSLDDRHIISLMTPKNEVVFFDIERSLEENMHALIESGHSCFPVCRGGMDDILGIVTTKHLLKKYVNKEPLDDITQHMSPAFYVPESLTGMTMLEQFRESHLRMVFVIDEYGDVYGLITLQDLLEALTGEFKQHDPEDMWAVHHEDGTWILDGQIPLVELKDRLKLKSFPEQEKGLYHTLSGMMMLLVGRVPHKGDTAEWHGWQLEVINLEGNRIDRVIARRIDDENEDDETLDSTDNNATSKE